MPEAPRNTHTKITAITNQKGGVGKTTTAINLAAALAKTGAKVLIVDLDPQGNASTGLGIEQSDRDKTTYDLLLGGAVVDDVALKTEVRNLWISPATADLSSADMELGGRSRRTSLLRDALKGVGSSKHRFDHILIDCPPSLNLLTVNAMVAADAVLVPLQSEFFALEGLSQLMLTVREIRDSANPDIRIDGIVLTMFDRRNNLSKLVERDARDNLGELVYKTVIPRNVRVSEAPSFALPVLDYDPRSAGAQAYLSLAREFKKRRVGEKRKVET